MNCHSGHMGLGISSEVAGTALACCCRSRMNSSSAHFLVHPPSGCQAHFQPVLVASASSKDARALIPHKDPVHHRLSKTTKAPFQSQGPSESDSSSSLCCEHSYGPVSLCPGPQLAWALLICHLCPEPPGGGSCSLRVADSLQILL